MDLHVFLAIFGIFMCTSADFQQICAYLCRIYMDFFLWDRSQKNHFYGTGPLILGPVHLIWDRSPVTVYNLLGGSKILLEIKLIVLWSFYTLLVDKLCEKKYACSELI